MKVYKSDIQEEKKNLWTAEAFDHDTKKMIIRVLFLDYMPGYKKGAE